MDKDKMIQIDAYYVEPFSDNQYGTLARMFGIDRRNDPMILSTVSGDPVWAEITNDGIDRIIKYLNVENVRFGFGWYNDPANIRNLSDGVSSAYCVFCESEKDVLLLKLAA